MPIEKKDIDRLKEIFVDRQEYRKQADTVEGKMNGNLVRLAVIETKLSQIAWILTAVGGGIITVLVKMFFDS